MKKETSTNHSPPVPFEEKYRPRTISGGYIEGYDLVGYCHFDGHKGYLRASHLKDHECLAKGCHYLEKNESSYYFMNMNFVKEKRKIAKHLKRLWIAGVLPTNVYMMYDSKLKDIEDRSELQRFYEQQVPITVDIGTLLSININGGDNNAEIADNSE